MWYNVVEKIDCKNQLEEIYADNAKGIKVRTKCQWYEEGEKSTNFFLNLEKTTATRDTVKKLKKYNKEIDNFVGINKESERFFGNLLKRKLRKTKHAYSEFLKDILLSTLSQEEKKFLTKKLVNKKWFLRWKVLVIKNLQETIVWQKSFMKTFWKNWNNQVKVSKNWSHPKGKQQ